MKITKKIICLVLSLLLLLPIAACSNNSVVVANYKDTAVDSNMFSYMLSSQKAYIEQLFYYYYGITDLDSLLSEEVSKDESGNKITYGDVFFEDIVNSLKTFVIVKQLSKEYNLSVTDESQLAQIEGYISQDAEFAGNMDFLEIALAQYGATVEDEKDYLYTTSLTSVLMDHLFGEKGSMKVPESDIRAEFDKSYTKIDMNVFSYTDSEGAAKIDKDITEEAIKAYFNTEYVKAEHILFYFYDKSDATGKTKIPEADMEAKRVKANELLSKIKNGEITFEDAKKDNNEDPGLLTKNDGDILKKGSMNEKFKDFEEKVFAMEIGDIELVETDIGVHIIRRNDVNEDDYSSKKTEISKAITKLSIQNEGKSLLEKLKGGLASIDGETTYGSYTKPFLFTEGEVGEEPEKIIKELDVGEYGIYHDDNYTVVFRKLEMTDDDYKSKHAEVNSQLSQEAFNEYITSLYPQVQLNEEEISKYTFAAVQSLNIQSYIDTQSK